MKTYGELTDAQKDLALGKAINALLEAICEGGIRFNDKLNKGNLQKRIDAAWAKAEAMRTPWFAPEHIMDTCRDDIEGMARCDAEDALYAEPGETLVYGVIQ